MRKQSLASWLAVLLAAVVFGAGCHPGEVDSLTDVDVVATFYEPEAAFGTYGTYAMQDTIYNLSVLDDPTVEDDLDRRNQALIYSEIRSEMQKLGYAEVDSGTGEDLRLGLGATTVDGQLLYTSFPWWGYNPGYWYPSWSTVDFTQGTLSIFLVDWQNRDSGAGVIDPIWNGNCVGVLDGNSTTTRLSNMISQAYEQSPYLQAAETSKEVQR